MLLLGWISLAHAETVPTEGVGFGQTREAALNAALADALRQASDSVLSSSSRASLSERDQSTKIDEAEKVSSVLSSETDRNIQSESEGHIAGHTVMSERQNPETGQWQIVVIANVVRFTPVGDTESLTRIKMAIIPFRWAVADPPGRDQSPMDFSSYLDQSIQAYFTQSRQFNVLDRKFVAERMAEHGYVVATSRRAEELVKLGQTLSADWMLTGEISEAKIIRTPVLLKGQGIYDEDISISVLGEYRVIDVATTQNKRSAPIRYSVKASSLPQQAMGDAQQMWRAVADQIGQSVEADIVGTIFPIRVSAIHEDGEIVLDRGGLGIQEGARYGVFKAGSNIQRPGSGASLGQDETRIGTIKIDRKIAKMSFARAVEGDIEKISVGDICRRVESAPESATVGTSLSSEDQRLKHMISRGALTTDGFADVLRGRTAVEVASIMDRRPVKAFDHGSQKTEIYRVQQQGKGVAQLEVTYSSKGVVILVR